MSLHRAFSRSKSKEQGDPSQKRPAVLVIDDERDILDTLSDQLRRRFAVLTAQQAEEALELVRNRDVSVILCDQRMPSTTGADLLSQILEVRPDATRILITGYSDIEAVIRAVNQGRIYAYVEKPWEPEALEALLDRAVERHRLVRQRDTLLEELRLANVELERRVQQRTRELEERNHELEEAYRRIEGMARRDPLTGVANRRGLEELLQRELHRAKRSDQPIALVMLDLDHFKSVNDSYGHAAGDAVLRTVGELLRANLRPYDIAARFGGEEFLLIFPGCDLEGGRAAAERLRRTLGGQTIAEIPQKVTASFGVTELQLDEGLDQAVKRADGALYQAKHRGRDRVEVVAAKEETS